MANVSGGGGLAALLKDLFITAKNRLQWGDLGGALVGAFLFQIWSGIIKLPLAFAEALQSVITSILGGLRAGVDILTDTVVGQAAAVWDPFQIGLFSIFANIAVILVAMYIAVRGYEVITDG